MNIISSLQSSGSATAIASVASAAPLKKSASGADATPVVGPAAAPVQSQTPPTGTELQTAVDQANKVLEVKTSNELQFSVDKSTDMAVVKMINKQTGETLLQFPSEAMLQIAKSIDQVTGAIFRKQA